MQPTAFTVESTLAMLWQVSWQAACLALLIWCVLGVLGQRIAARWRFVLWSLVFVRLALPFLPASPTSAFQLLDFTADTRRPLGVSTVNSGPVIYQPPLGETARIPVEPPQFVQQPAVQDDALSEAFERPLTLWQRLPNWGTSCLVLWLVGVGFWLTRRGYQGILLRRRMATWNVVTDERAQRLFDACRQRLCVNFPVRLMTTDDETGPAMTGIWTPIIVVSQSVLTDFSDAQLEMIFCHELAHIRRRDLLIQEVLLTLRAIHWFNPVAWWALLRIQLEREMACDELVLETNGQDQRNSYGLTLLQIAEQTRTPLAAPALLGTSDTPSRLQRRLLLIRDYRPRTWRTPLLGIGTILVAAAIGLTNPPLSRTAGSFDGDAAQAVAAKDNPDKSFEITGRCVDDDHKPIAGVQVELLRFDYFESKSTQIAVQSTNTRGEYFFANLKPLPKSRPQLSSPYYVVVAKKAKHSSTAYLVYNADQMPKFDLELSDNIGTLSGRVSDARGQPLEGAEVFVSFGRAIPGFQYAVTDKDGKYSIQDLKQWKQNNGIQIDPKTGLGYSQGEAFLRVRHRDYPVTRGSYAAIPSTVDVILKPGMTIEGLVIDHGKPVASALVTAQAIRGGDQEQAVTDQSGKYRLVLTEGEYNIRVVSEDRTCVALDSFSGPVGQITKAPDLQLIEGGFIIGKVVDKATGRPLTKAHGQPLHIGNHGPSHPRSGAAVGGAEVNDDGTYRLRVAPGENYPYIMAEVEAERNSSNALDAKPIIVRNGETVTFDFHVRLPAAVRRGNRDPVPLNDKVTQPQAAASVKPIPTAEENAPPTNYAIKGRCVDENGKPLSDAEVALFYFERFGIPPTQKWTLKSGPAGEYHFQNLKPLADSERTSWSEYYLVLAKKAKYLPNARHMYARYENLGSDIRLYNNPNPSTLSGQVTDERGKPIPNVEVYGGPAGVPLPGFTYAITDDNGRYSISDMRPGKFGETETVEVKEESIVRKVTRRIGGGVFWFKHPDFPITRGVHSQIPEEVNMVLKPGVIIEGRVVEKGQPVAGARIIVHAVTESDRRPADDLTQEPVQVATGADGTYRLFLKDDLYNIRVQAKDRISVALDSFVGKVGEITRAPDLELVEGGFIVGRVINDATGKPVRPLPQVLPIGVAHYGPGFPRSGGGVGSTNVAEDGSYRLRVAPGLNDVWVIGPWGRLAPDKQVSIRDGETVTFDFHVNGPAEGNANALGDDPLPRRSAKTPEIAPKAKTATSIPRRRSTYEIKGHCVDGNGKPLADAEVALFYFARPGIPPTQKWTQRSGDSGEFHFEKLKPLDDSATRSSASAHYLVWARKPKFVSAAHGILVKEDLSNVELKLGDNPGTLSGRVTNEQGEPLKDVEVYLGLRGAPAPGFNYAITDQDGRYAISDLKRWKAHDTKTVDAKSGLIYTIGLSHFHLKHPDYPTAGAPYTEIPQEVNVVMKRGVTIEGRVIESGKPVAGVTVSAGAIGKSKRRSADSEYRAWELAVTNADGSYRFHLPDDEYNVLAKFKDRICVALDSLSGTVGQVTKAPDLELIEGGYLVGRIIDDETGKPVRLSQDGERWMVAHYGPAFPLSGAEVGSAEVSADGSYRLRVAPGENYPYLMSRGMLGETVNVRAGETVTFDFHINGPAEDAARAKQLLPPRAKK